MKIPNQADSIMPVQWLKVSFHTWPTTGKKQAMLDKEMIAVQPIRRESIVKTQCVELALLTSGSGSLKAAARAVFESHLNNILVSGIN